MRYWTLTDAGFREVNPPLRASFPVSGSPLVELLVPGRIHYVYQPSAEDEAHKEVRRRRNRKRARLRAKARELRRSAGGKLLAADACPAPATALGAPAPAVEPGPGTDWPGVDWVAMLDRPYIPPA
jgi:hypothetical protein